MLPERALLLGGVSLELLGDDGHRDVFRKFRLLAGGRLNEVHGVDHAPEVNHELAGEGEEVGGVEDGSQRPDVRQRVHRGRVGERERRRGERRSAGDHLVIAAANPVEVKNREGVRADQAGEHEHLLHLDSGHQRAPPLSDDVHRASNGRDAGGKRRRHRGVAEFHLRRLHVLRAFHLLHHLRKPGHAAAAVRPRALRLPALGLGDHAAGGSLHGAELGPLFAGGGA